MTDEPERGRMITFDLKIGALNVGHKKTGQEAKLPDRLRFITTSAFAMLNKHSAKRSFCCRFCSERGDERPSHIMGSGQSIELCEVLSVVFEQWYTCVSEVSTDLIIGWFSEKLGNTKIYRRWPTSATQAARV